VNVKKRGVQARITALEKVKKPTEEKGRDRGTGMGKRKKAKKLDERNHQREITAKARPRTGKHLERAQLRVKKDCRCRSFSKENGNTGQKRGKLLEQRSATQSMGHGPGWGGWEPRPCQTPETQARREAPCPINKGRSVSTNGPQSSGHYSTKNCPHNGRSTD